MATLCSHFLSGTAVPTLKLEPPGLPIDSGGLVRKWTAMVLRGQPEVVHLQGDLGLEMGESHPNPWPVGCFLLLRLITIC